MTIKANNNNSNEQKIIRLYFTSKQQRANLTATMSSIFRVYDHVLPP